MVNSIKIAKSKIQRPVFVATGKYILALPKKLYKRFIGLKLRYRFIFAAAIMVLAEVYSLLAPYFADTSYALGSAETLLPTSSPQMAAFVSLDSSKQQFNFKPVSSNTSTTTSLQSNYSSASLYADSSKGITATDTANKIDFTMIPKFTTYTGRQDQDRIVYPLSDGNGWMVYTLRGDGVKEDIILEHTKADSTSYSYTLGLGDSLSAKLEVDGSVGIYGSTLLSGNVATGSSADAALLAKARQNTPKTTLLFSIPKPVVTDKNGPVKNIPAKYSLSGNTLTVNVTGLKKGNYPLAIDPSVYVVTAAQFMQGNNETNVDFDVDNKLIKKASTTGARFDQWNATSGLPAAVWGAETVAAGGYIYSIGGTELTGATFTSQGASTYTVPVGVTSLTVKAWGGGGGGGGGGRNSTNVGGAGGGAGYAKSTITVTPGETLDIYVGAGGSAGAGNARSGVGAGGGGYSDVSRSGTELVDAAGGAGGAGGGETTSGGISGGTGGAGGGTTGVTGGSSGTANGGAGGGGGGGGNGGSGGGNQGSGGGSLQGGGGGDGRSGAGTDGSGSSGGALGGGNGGSRDVNNYYAGGGGGGGGYYGGGGGSGGQSGGGGGGGGGGSSYTSGSTNTNTAGSGKTPGNSSDPDIGTAGQGGGGGATRANGSDGTSGTVVISYGTGSSSVTNSVNWAQFDTGTGTINSPNPGTGACSGWCSQSAYALPDGRANFSLVAYNGFLYAMGGTSANCQTTGAFAGTGTNGYCKTVYIARLGANGEPRLWSPTSSDTSTWTYWNRDTNLPSERAYAGAVAYNNHMYFMGGRTSSGATNVVHVANITPTGQLTSWTSSGNTLPTANQYDFSAQQYNGNLYVIGGSNGPTSAPTNTVRYSKINSDGTINAWQQTSSFTTGRISGGSNLSVVWGAYIYISGGCTSVNGSGYCTNVASDAQVASINADGSIDGWNTMAGVTDARMSYSLIAWRNNIYEIGGCSAQNTSTGDCNSNMLSTINYGSVNTDGDASTVGDTVASGTSPCSGGSPYNCDLPSSIGNVLNATAIINGYLYIMGGCTNNACTTVSTTITYQAIGSDGSLQRPATCSGSYTDSYCVSSVSLPAGLAASGSAVFNGRIYLVGGFNTGTNIYYVSVNSDGSLGTWAATDLSSIGAPNTLDYAYAFARANASAASSVPGNLYIIGGCTSAAVGCSGYSPTVDKCNLSTTGVPSACTTSGQVQMQNVVNGTNCGTGLGAMVGTIYAGYIYLIGGLTPNCTDLTTARYAKIDSSNNIVTVGTGWVEGPYQTATGRRRGAGFGYNGYIYVVGGYDGTTGVLADIEFAKINVSDGSWGPWTVSSVTINQRWGLSVPVSNSYAYVIGGCVAGAAPSACSSRTNVTQTFQIYNNDSGAPASYSTSAHTYATNPNRIGVTSAILNGYLYVAGGCTGTTDCTTAVNTVSYAPIDVYGNLGTWSNTTTALPAVRAWGKLLVSGGTLYYVGGQDNSAVGQSTVYYGTPSSGNISSWGTASNALPSARTQFGAAAWNNRMYIVGGAGTGTGCTGGVCNTVYVSPQLNSGGNITSAWSTGSTSFDVARKNLVTVAYANNLYVLGGFDGSNYFSDTQFSQINSTTGDVGSWLDSKSLPGPIAGGDGFAANGYVYIIGGRSATTSCSPVTLVAPISANTTISSGNNPTGIGEWFQTNQAFTGDRYGNAASYSNGKAYVMGGACGSTLIYPGTPTQQTALLSQPQVANYSIMFDTDSDVYPTNWLLNGVDNSIGAQWQLSYQSMTDPTKNGPNGLGKNCSAAAMTTWGQTTNFGNVTLKLPGVYTTLDGSGANTHCARYYFLNISVDAQNSFGYPDDVTRGPTITDLTLGFTADPAKRLMHGRTFVGGLQQPDDTPYYAH